MLHHVMRECGPRPLNLVISADTAGVNLFTLAGSPATPINVTLTINSGIYVYSSSTGTPALNVPAFPVGSTVLIVNNGYIVGMGGDGSNGTGNASSAPNAGHDGGPAIGLGNDVAIDNTFGTIGGGGGGGGGGAGAGQSISAVGGGGGGGGQSKSATGHGSGAGSGTAGSNGGASGPGSGGTGDHDSFYGTSAGGGGKGGTYGQKGAKGGSGTGGGFAGNVGGAGGQGGNAITLNGHAVTWLGGNVPAQVLGAVA
jgi:hypothetical protein